MKTLGPTMGHHKTYKSDAQQNKRTQGDYLLEDLKQNTLKKEQTAKRKRKKHSQELPGREHRGVHPECTLHNAAVQDCRR